MDLELDAQSTARRDRLAKLRNLKRKQQEEEEEEADTSAKTEVGLSPETGDASTFILSGRNYDIMAKAPKLGFDGIPIQNEDTLEAGAIRIALETRKAIADDADGENPIDLLSLQPKKLNWDLKRDVDKRLQILDHRTNNAIARVIREKVLQAHVDKVSDQRPEQSLFDAVRKREREREGNEMMDSEN